jgi:hypothetical protein
MLHDCDLAYVLSPLRQFICGLQPPQPYPTHKTWRATFNYDWKQVKDAYFRSGELMPTWLLHWPGAVQELVTPFADVEQKQDAIMMASLAVCAHDPCGIAFACEAWGEPHRRPDESEEDYGRRLASKQRVSEHPDAIECLGLMMLYREGGQVKQICRDAEIKRDKHGKPIKLVQLPSNGGHSDIPSSRGWVESHLISLLKTDVSAESREAARGIIRRLWAAQLAESGAIGERQTPTLH